MKRRLTPLSLYLQKVPVSGQIDNPFYHKKLRFGILTKVAAPSAKHVLVRVDGMGIDLVMFDTWRGL